MPYMVTCTGMAAGECLLVVEGNDTAFQYDEIRRFSFEWGVAQKIRIRVTEVMNPPADGSSFRYELLDVIEREAGVAADFWLQTGSGSGRSVRISRDSLIVAGYSRGIAGLHGEDSLLVAAGETSMLYRIRVAMDSSGALTVRDVQAIRP